MATDLESGTQQGESTELAKFGPYVALNRIGSEARAILVELEFRRHLSTFEATVHGSLDETHALINGKWLFEYMAPTLWNRDPSQCEYNWLAHARSSGGLHEVRAWWERVTGFPP